MPTQNFILHTSNGQQNFIADLLINLSQNLLINLDKFSKLLLGLDSSLKLIILIH